VKFPFPNKNEIEEMNVIQLKATGWMIRGSSRVRSKRFQSSIKCFYRSLRPITPVLNGLLAYLPGVKRPGLEADRSTPSISAEI